MRKIIAAFCLFAIVACNSSKVKEALDLADRVDRKPIDTTILGTNAFVNDDRFGSISAQFLEIRDTLRLKYVRVLLDWNESVQPSPGTAPNFSFYDDIIGSIPSGVDALVLVTGVPAWMSDSGNWTDGNPRGTFANSWVKKVAKRYGNNARVVGFEVWNEPNSELFPDNSVMQVLDSPENYVELLTLAANVLRDNAPGKLIVSGATSAINQNYSETLDYNRGMRDAGAESMVDVWGVHYYGKQYENVKRNGGVSDFLNELSKPIWITESGAQGVNSQLAYGEEVWPFLRERVPGIQRIYQYQFAEATPADVTYGLKNLTAGAGLSDLYVFLRDR